jgi:hypothetical protein
MVLPTPPPEQTILEFIRDAASSPDDSYDTVLLTHTNAVMFGLYQLGALTLKTVTPTTLWTDLTVTKPSILEVIKQIISLRVRYLFDSTASQQGTLYEAFSEYESRLLIELDLHPVIPVPPAPPVIPQPYNPW